MGGLTIPEPGSSSRGRARGRRLRRKKKPFALQLTSLMDILMIIVIFLLKSYGISSMGIVQADKLELPVSKAPDTFGEGMALVVSKDKITLDSELILEFKGKPEDKKFELPDGAFDTSNSALGIFPLYEKLKKKKDDYDFLASRAADPKAAKAKWTGDLMVHADKAVNYSLIRQIMYTAGMAGYKQFRLTVEKRPE